MKMVVPCTLLSYSQSDRIVVTVPGNVDGHVVTIGDGLGYALNQLNCPTDVLLLIDKQTHSLIICYYRNSGKGQDKVLL